MMTESFQYPPYNLLLSGDSSKTPFLFNGMYGVMTDSNGLYYMRARFYSPEIKRFINQDILIGNVFEGQTLNRYAFVTGQPVSFVDPFGLRNWKELGGRVKNNSLRPILIFNWDLNELMILNLGEYSPLLDYDVDYVIDFIDNCAYPKYTKIRNLHIVSIEQSGEWEWILGFNTNPNGKTPDPATLKYRHLINLFILKSAKNIQNLNDVRNYCKQQYCDPECKPNCIPIP